MGKPGTPALLVGSPGTGKRMLVHSIAHECGANLFDLTPSNTEGKYPGKKAYEMVHTTFKVAKAMQPSVVWMDAAESVFASGKKKGASLLELTDRVLIMGSSSQPYLCEKKKDYDAFVGFFPKVLYLPLPDYPSRQILWTRMLEKGGVDRPNPDEVQTLSRISEYYSSGSVCTVVNRQGGAHLPQ